MDTRLLELHLGSTSEQQSQISVDVANTVEQIEEERTGLDLSRKLLGDLLLRAREEAIFKATSEIQSSSTHNI